MVSRLALRCFTLKIACYLKCGQIIVIYFDNLEFFALMSYVGLVSNCVVISLAETEWFVPSPFL